MLMTHSKQWQEGIVKVVTDRANRAADLQHIDAYTIHMNKMIAIITESWSFD